MIKWMAGAAIAGSVVLMGATARTPQTNTTGKPFLDNSPYPGQLAIFDEKGKAMGLCPLERTSVNAQITGFGARVSVVQTFVNTSREPIEAVYTFPLPNDAGVDRMRMKIGDRIIEGNIKRREEARRIYDAAKAMGQQAALLDQERPNIFTQSVANITPGARIQIEISYVQLLKYREGIFEFNFPMVVGPRFLGNAQDPGKIDPPRSTRVGTNIDLTVDIDAGSSIADLSSVLHEVKTTGMGGNRARVQLARQDEIPNKDFILRYRVAGDQPKTAFLTHTDKRGGFFTLVVLPPARPKADQIMPREIIFVMDQSGSQGGFPIEKSKELTLKMIKQLRPGDTFNVFGFNNTVRSLWNEARANTAENISQAEAFVGAMQANGGTQLREGVVAALNNQFDASRQRIVLFNTDGYVGDEAMILDTIQKQRDRARMFTFGIGNSVNRYLIDAMAEEGRGDAEYVTLAEAADKAVESFVRRTQTLVLTDLTVNFTGVTVTDVQPAQLPDVYSDRPLVLYGRFTGGGNAQATINGKLGGQPWSQTLNLSFSGRSDAPALPILWARKKVAEVERTNYLHSIRGEQQRSNVVEEITNLGLDFGIMTQYTSFVAVESRVVNVGGKQRTVAVPVEQADGVTFEAQLDKMALNARAQASGRPGYAAPTGGVGGGGFGGGGSALPTSPTLGVSKSKGSLDPAEKERLGAAVSETPSQKKSRVSALKIAAKLLKAKGPQEVQVWLSKVDPTILAALKKAGLIVGTSDKGLKIVFGTCDAGKLGDLALLDAVVRIEPL